MVRERFVSDRSSPTSDPDKSIANLQLVQGSVRHAVNPMCVCHNWALRLALWFRALSPIPIPVTSLRRDPQGCVPHEPRHTHLKATLYPPPTSPLLANRVCIQTLRIRTPFLISMSRCPAGAISPVSMFRASSVSPTDKEAHTPVVQAEDSRQPSKALQVGEQFVNKDIADSPSDIGRHLFRTHLRDLHPWLRSRRETGSSILR